ncbi:MAG: SDR family oxidoreductase [Gemmatimonadetes bacterium]|nr:SDR family oxidoreductase [Gemmatimonadota bacterium]
MEDGVGERVLVTGATGKVGGALVRLLADAGRDVKAATRRPWAARERLGELADEVVELDYGRAETYDAAVEWADRLFVVAPPFHPRASDHMSSFVDWAVQAGVEHVVLLTAMGIETRDDLALRRLERLVEETGVAWTFLRPNIYMQNFQRGFLRREIQGEGTFHLPAGDARISLVDARDVAEVAARTLSGDRHVGRAYTLTGPEAVDHHRVAAILGQAAGRDIRYVPTEDDAMCQRLLDLGWPAGHADVVVEFFHSIRGDERARVTGDVEEVLEHQPRGLEAFAREYAETWR